MDNPREAALSKAAESIGGKLEAFYIFPMGGEFDGMAIQQLPSDWP
jgi:uncharacterized protein with GYD domain